MARKGFALDLPVIKLARVIGLIVVLGILVTMLMKVGDFMGTARYDYSTVEPGTGSDIDLCERDIDSVENVRILSIILHTESASYGGNSGETVAVGYTVMNRMANRGTTSVLDVASGYQGYNDWEGEEIPDEAEGMAKDILRCAVEDKTKGATHYYSPISMPKESAAQEDCYGDYITCAPASDIVPGLDDEREERWLDRFGNDMLLEEVEGLGEKNYRPSWANPSFTSGEIDPEWEEEFPDLQTQSFERICIEDVRTTYFKFYKQPGDGSGEKEC